MNNHIAATPESGKRFYMDFHQKGRVVMLNLLKFRETANYTNLESIKPETEISGEEAYKIYMEKTVPELDKAGSKILFYGNSRDFVIGPEEEKWDVVLLVEHRSVEDFMKFTQNEEYLKHAGHRTAALEDSRLLPISQKEKAI